MENSGLVRNAFLSMGKKPLDESLVIPLDEYEEQEEADRGKKRFYGFKLLDIQLLLDADIRSEVINDVVVTPLPLMPSFISGLCNVRGNLVPVYNMYEKLDLENTEDISSNKKVLVLGENENMAGIEVREMVMSLEFDEQDICRDVLSDNHKLNECITYSYQQNGSNWFGFDYKKLFKIAD
ncbi:MAG: chemotaxis protein CheW [Gammaproteobacteria bacterium]|nr:chemotaxis protein CheW [Gammaproteobacteria bacterium]